MEKTTTVVPFLLPGRFGAWRGEKNGGALAAAMLDTSASHRLRELLGSKPEGGATRHPYGCAWAQRRHRLYNHRLTSRGMNLSGS